MFNRDAELSRSRFEYLVARRDQLLDRLRFGILALNGASLVALISALGGDGAAATWIGLNPPRAKESAAAFVVGTIFAVVSIMIDANIYRTEAGDAEVRRSTLSRLTALYEAPMSKENYDRAGAAMSDYHKLPPVDFQFSKWAIMLLNASGGAWLFGVGVPLSSALGW